MQRLNLLLSVIVFLLAGCKEQPAKANPLLTADSAATTTSQPVETELDTVGYKIITAQLIDQTPDDKLMYLIGDHQLDQLPADYTQEYKTIMSWNKSQQAIYMIFHLEGEVENGGFNQFYYNSRGMYHEHLPDALKLVGAHKFAALMQRANQTFEKEKATITKHWDGTKEGFSESYKENPLNQYDDQFYELEKSELIETLLVKYVREHKEDFVDRH